MKICITNQIINESFVLYVKGVKTLTLLNYVPYIKDNVVKTLADEYGYQTYGQKHFENLLTKFLEGYWSVTRFGFDIRRAQLASLVVTNQMTRDDALEILKNPPLTEEESKSLFTQVAQKLQISEAELMRYHDMPMSTIHYKNNSWAFNVGVKLYTMLGLDKRIRK